MASVTLPAGCKGLDFADGTKTPPSAQGTSIEVSDAHARALKKSWYGQTGVIGRTGYSFGTKAGRVCPCSPGRTWNAWSLECPKCGGATTAA